MQPRDRPEPAVQELLAAHEAVDHASQACDRAYRLSLEAPAGESRQARRALDQAERDLETAVRRLRQARDALEPPAPDDEKSWGAH